MNFLHRLFIFIFIFFAISCDKQIKETKLSYQAYGTVILEQMPKHQTKAFILLNNNVLLIPTNLNIIYFVDGLKVKINYIKERKQKSPSGVTVTLTDLAIMDKDKIF